MSCMATAWMRQAVLQGSLVAAPLPVYCNALRPASRFLGPDRTGRHDGYSPR